jgi:hypothetical protein
MTAGIDRVPSISRQLGESIIDMKNTMQYDKNIPPEPINCGSVFNCPLISDGAVSDIYKGTRVTARPTPKPSSSFAKSRT